MRDQNSCLRSTRRVINHPTNAPLPRNASWYTASLVPRGMDLPSPVKPCGGVGVRAPLPGPPVLTQNSWANVLGWNDRKLKEQDHSELFLVCCRVNVAHMRQPRPDSGLGVQVKALQNVWVVPFSLGSGWYRAFSFQFEPLWTP